MSSRVRRIANRVVPGRRARRAEAKLERVRARLERSRGRVQESRARLRETVASQQARLAEGRAAMFDYPVVPRRRTFGRPGKDFFGSLMVESEERTAALLRDIGPSLAPLAQVSQDETDPALPFWSNPWLPPLDGVTLYGLVATLRPTLYMEVGSGFSTKFVRMAIRDHGLETKVVSIDPQPRAEVDELCDEVIRSPYEDIDLDVLDRLGPGDMLFVDNSHRSFANSDVTVFFTETLPYLRPGVVYGLHDIFVPQDYPDDWNDRFYAEQYLLMSYLAGGAGGDEILLGTHHLAASPHLLEHLTPFLPRIDTPLDGGGFWMTRAGSET